MGEVHNVVAGLVESAPPELRDLFATTADATASSLTEQTLQRIFVSGRATLAGDSSLEREDLTRVLELLEEKTSLARVLSASVTDEDEPIVTIGDENELEVLHSTSLVAQRYQLITAGSLGVLGPTRMDYASVLATVRAVAEQLQSTLTHFSE
jgi:heat-inducible transcriptional repressor